MKKNLIVTDCDLDGIGSYLVYKWFTKTKAQHLICSLSNFKRTWVAHFNNNKLSDYDKIIIFDLDTSRDSLSLVDHENITIIDHHDTHIENKDKYKKAKTILVDTTSCCKLIYSICNKKYKTKLTDKQKLLVAMIDDYDSYELKLPDSYKLNVVLWNYVGKREIKFCEDFSAGFNGFSQTHKNIISLNDKKVARIISELEIYKAKLPIAGEQYNIYATMASSSLNEVAHHIIDSYDCDICMVMNPKTKRVSFRKNKESAHDVDLGKLADKLADGGGHIHSSGGNITDRIMSLTKILQPL